MSLWAPACRSSLLRSQSSWFRPLSWSSHRPWSWVGDTMDTLIADTTIENTTGTRIDTGDIITTMGTVGKQGTPQDVGAYRAHPRRHRRGWMAGIMGLVRLLSVPGTALWRAVGSMTRPPVST